MIPGEREREGGGERYTLRYTVLTRMTDSAFRWAGEGRYTYRSTVIIRKINSAFRWAAVSVSHFNVCMIVGDKVRRQCPHNKPIFLEEKAEPKPPEWNRTDLRWLTSRTSFTDR